MAARLENRSFSFGPEVVDHSPPIKAKTRINSSSPSEENNLNLLQKKLSDDYINLMDLISKIPINTSEKLKYVYSKQKIDTLNQLDQTTKENDNTKYKNLKTRYDHLNTVTNFLDGIFFKKIKTVTPLELIYSSYKEEKKSIKDTSKQILCEIIALKTNYKKSNRISTFLHIVDQIFYTFDCLFSLLGQKPENLLYSFEDSFNKSDTNRFNDDYQTYNDLCDNMFRLMILIKKLERFSTIPSIEELAKFKNKIFHYYNNLLYLSTYNKEKKSFDFDTTSNIVSTKNIEAILPNFMKIWEEISSLFKNHENNNTDKMLNHYSTLKEEALVELKKNCNSFSKTALPNLPQYEEKKEKKQLSSSILPIRTSMPTIPQYKADSQPFFSSSPTPIKISVSSENNKKKPIKKIPSAPILPELPDPISSDNFKLTSRKRNLVSTDIKPNNSNLHELEKNNPPMFRKLIQITAIMNFLTTGLDSKEITPLEIIIAAYNNVADRNFAADSLIESYTQAPFYGHEHKNHANWLYIMNEIYRGLYSSFNVLKNTLSNNDSEKNYFKFKSLNYFFTIQNMSRSIIYLGILSKISPELREEIEEIKKSTFTLNSKVLNYCLEQINEFEFNGFGSFNTF